MNQIVLNNVGDDSCDISGKGEWPDAAGVPEEFNFFEAHGGHTRG